MKVGGVRIVITGGGGVLGQLLARQLIDRNGLATTPGGSCALTELVLLDRTFPQQPVTDQRIRPLQGEISDSALLAQAFSGGVDALFHFAAVVSAGAEADFELG